MYREINRAPSLKPRIYLEELVNAWGQSLWEGAASGPQTPILSTHAAVFISPNATVDFVYNVYEIPCVPLV